MFVFRREDLPPDAEFPANLEKLGYFINEKDQIRKISDPEQEFQFKINRNARYNEVHREMMNTCIRTIVSSRLQDLGLTTLRLPLSSTPNDPHVPIWVSPNLSTASRIVVVFGEPNQDLGIWAYRSIGTQGIHAGSAVSFANAVLGRKNGGDQETSGDTALVLANTGQLIWNCGSRRAVTHPSWIALPRRSAVDPPMTMSQRNKIPGNANWQEHVDCVFDEILGARGKLVKADAKIDIIGLAEGGLGAIRYLANDWEIWRPYISGICLSNPLQFTHIDLLDTSASSFSAFVSSRCRAYVLSDRPLGMPVSGFREHGCNCYSSGEELNIECIMASAWESMLEWLGKVHADPGYCEKQLMVQDVEVDLETSGDGPSS
ncbi:hypothetical protein ASPWEDRAFT_103510 [Aspergillus wentii DTO 134E9]|uniref:Arb2 domain-containing protein n=1 Tax=Aspergillus wentii DTO 134E9 TaxID=1073089 RepID=A0A1L9RVZ7_ASPWE|nr:uncharacterized protein ASPWEDRAFT_103510 [Aspergillus wentii DTO 134E9]KAI9929242.1 hypothetical protein MW887_001650 [Aspergillus wentii]OJJ39053.1 hypothetical protein ASPWEDRAFT_103510 [Aspergillus wentii DTO 134E9]